MENEQIEQITENQDQEDLGGHVSDKVMEEAFDTKEDLQCRFYREEWPSIEDLVVVSKIILKKTLSYFRSILAPSAMRELT